MPTADVKRILHADGWPAPAAWLDFHDRYAGYVERIYHDTAVWGLAHEESSWFGPRSVQVDEEDGRLTIYCAELHPSYGYQLDPAGRFLGSAIEADSFDVHVERLAVWREFITGGQTRRETDERFLRDPGYRAELLARLAERQVSEASDSFSAWYADEWTLVRDDLRCGRLRNVLWREQ